MSSQALFVLEKKTFVAGIEIDRRKTTRCIGADSLHEPKCICQGGDDLGVFTLKFWIAYVAEFPVEWSMKISKSRIDGASDEVEGACRVKVCTGYGVSSDEQIRK